MAEPVRDVDWRTLASVFDAVIPADEAPGGWLGGGERLLREHASGALGWAIPAVRAVEETLAEAVPGRDVGTLGCEDLAAALRVLLDAERRRGVDGRAGAPVSALVDLAFQAYYGGTSEPAGWAVAGYRPSPGGLPPVEPDPPRTLARHEVASEYDVVVVGGGAGRVRRG